MANRLLEDRHHDPGAVARIGYRHDAGSFRLDGTTTLAQIPGPEDHEGIFERSHKEKRIDRILEAAMRKRVREAEKAKPLRKIKPLVKAANIDLSKVLATALGANVKGKKKASVRAKGADGARSFHFEAYYTSRDPVARDALRDKRRANSSSLSKWGEANNIKPHGTGPNNGSSAGGGPRDAAGTKSNGGRGSGAAHLAYIEREGAVERIDLEREIARELGLEDALDAKAPARGRGRPTKEQQAEQVAHAIARMAALEEIAAVLKERRERALDEPALETQGAGKAKKARHGIDKLERENVRERDPFERDTAGRGQAAAAQAYMENPQKLRNGEISLSSFGNIGDTFEERSRFWDLLEENETVAMARTQNRLIMELPHQATPEARARIMRDFAQTFEEMGLPYHVAIHAPGPQNDDRNFHAHIVWSERPAKRMLDPATGDIEWDFAIVASYRTTSRNTRTHHPHRQPRNRDVTRKDFIPKIRRHYAECVNAVMKDVDPSVKFDPRSYKDMGITTDPIETVSRITNERLLNGRLVIQDADWTKRMVEAELGKAVLARSKDVAALIDTTRRLEKLKAAWPSVNKINAEVGVFSKMMGIGRFTKATYLQLVNQRLAYENLRLQERVVTRAEATVVKDVLEATSKARREALGPDRQPAFDAEAREAMAAIHEAATAEMADIKERSMRERQRLNGFVLQNKLAWRRTGDMMMPPQSARPIPKFVETPDPKTGKIPFLAGAAAEAPKAPKIPTTSKTAPTSKTPLPKAGTTAKAAPAAAAAPSGAGNAKPTSAKTQPAKTQGPAPIPARAPDKKATDKTAAIDPAKAGDPTGMRQSQEHARVMRERVEQSEAQAKKARAETVAYFKAVMETTMKRYIELSISTFGGLRGAELGAAVRKFNEDLGKEGPKSTGAADIAAFMATGKFPYRPENHQQPANAPTEVTPGPGANAPTGGQPNRQDGATPRPAATSARSAQTRADASPQEPKPAGSPTSQPHTDAARAAPTERTQSSAAPKPTAGNLFDHLEIVETPRRPLDPPPSAPSASVEPAATPQQATSTPIAAEAASDDAATPTPQQVRSAPRAAASQGPAAPVILSEGDLDGVLGLPANVAKTDVETTRPRAPDRPDPVAQARPEDATNLVPPSGEKVAEDAPQDELEEPAAQKRKRAARRAGFVKHGIGGRGR